MATQALQPASQAGTVATTPKKNDLQQWIRSDQFKAAVASALPKHLTPDRFVRVALNAFMRTPDLLKCTQESIFRCMLDLSASGLEADGRRAHLIPFKRNQKDGNGWKTTYECQLIYDYKGLVELAYRSGTISNIHADKICDNDEFDYDRGLVLKHKIDFRRSRGSAYAYYARVVFKDGTETADVMTMDEINAIRSRSKSKDNGPWVTDYDEMAKKTVFRRLSKWITLSPEFRDALDRDDDAVIDVPARRQPEVASISVESFAPSEDSNRGHDAANDALPAPADDEQPGEEPAPTEAVTLDPDAGVTEARAEEVRVAFERLQLPERKKIMAHIKAQNVYQMTNAQADLALTEIAALKG